MQEEAVASFRPSPQQEELWLAEPEGPTGRIQATIVVRGDASVAGIREALDRIVQRHEILRTTFQRRPGMRVPLQVVAPSLQPAWTEHDLSVAPPAEQEQRLEDLARAEREQAIDFDAGPLVRAALVSLAVDWHVLVVTIPTVCADERTAPTLVDEIAAIYSGDDGIVDEPLQYADFSEWQHELLATDDEAAGEARALWQKLGDVSAPPVPFLRAVAGRHVTDRIRVETGASTEQAIAPLAEKYGVPRDVVVQTAWQLFLARVAGTEDVTVGTIEPTAPHAELDGAIGAFARPVPVRASLAGTPTFAEALDRVSRARSDASAAQDYLPSDLAARVDVGFVAVATPTRARADGVVFGLQDVSDAGRFALALRSAFVRDSWDLELVFDPRALTRDDAARLARSFATLLDDAVRDSNRTVDLLAILTELDRDEILRGFNATAAPVQETTIDALVAAAAARHPDATAVVDAAGSITYAELDTRANQLAHRLREAGATAGKVVGLCTDRSVEMVVGLLGILKSGAAYLPLNFEHPRARLAHQLAETDAVALVTQDPLLDRLPHGGVVVSLDGDRSDLDARPRDAPESAVAPDDLVYVIYTSGSTGTPKGVAVTHRNLVNYVGDMVPRLGADAGQLAFGMVTAISTDLGNTAVFPALCSGGTLVLVPPTVAADAAAFGELASRAPVDILKITPSHLAALLSAADADGAFLPRKVLVTGGEAATWDLIARVRERGSCRILNHYGPTETTVGSCTYLVPDAPNGDSATVPVGAPIANTLCYVLDSHSNPVPVGVAGELYVGGAGVAREYVQQPEETRLRFVADPFVGGAARMYATGDLARWLPDGSLEFLGRADDQVKIRGFRVEPAEIESALRRIEGVREAIVLARDEGHADSRLVGYVVGDVADPAALRTQLAEWLPEFMVPSAFVMLDELPRTASGKIDRRSLPAPEDYADVKREAYVAPRTPVEEAIAAIWSEVLGVERVGVHDDFFAIGGHSLLATQIVAQIRSDFSIELPLHSLFTSPTVETLSATVLELMGEGEDAEVSELVAQLEHLSDEEARRLLAGDVTPDE